MSRSHTSKGRPVVYVHVNSDGRFVLVRHARNGTATRHAKTYANTQAAHRAARTFYPGVRIERVS